MAHGRAGRSGARAFSNATQQRRGQRLVHNARESRRYCVNPGTVQCVSGAVTAPISRFVDEASFRCASTASLDQDASCSSGPTVPCARDGVAPATFSLSVFVCSRSRLLSFALYGARFSLLMHDPVRSHTSVLAPPNLT